MALVGGHAVRQAGHHHDAEQQDGLVEHARQAAPQTRSGRGHRRKRRTAGHGLFWGGDEAGLRTLAPCGPLSGSKVLRSTKPGVAAIFGMPACWSAGGAGCRVTSVVVAPGAACTTVGATGLTWVAECDGLATMLRLLAASGGGLVAGSPGFDEPLARLANALRSLSGNA